MAKNFHHCKLKMFEMYQIEIHGRVCVCIRFKREVTRSQLSLILIILNLILTKTLIIDIVNINWCCLSKYDSVHVKNRNGLDDVCCFTAFKSNILFTTFGKCVNYFRTGKQSKTKNK